jgi:hypothetical protein
MSLTKRNLEMTFENAVNTNALYVGVKNLNSREFSSRGN